MGAARISLTLVASSFIFLPLAHAQTGESAAPPAITEKLNAYVACINRLSERAYESRSRYFSWVKPKGPTGKERIIYGTYTIYETDDCKAGVEKANALDPDDASLEAAATAYVEAVVALEPLLKEADDYYQQENYKDDKMAKGKAMHPKLVTAWDAFATADVALRTNVEAIQDKMAAEKLAELEKSEGRKDAYFVQAIMLQAKALLRQQSAAKPDIEKIKTALAEFEATAKAAEDYTAANKDTKIGSGFIDATKGYLTSTKQLMRRVRDKVRYSKGDRMMIEAGGGWMVEGSPDRVMRDYNQLVESFNRGASF